MPEFKIVIGEKGKSYAKTLSNEESEIFINKKLKDKVLGDNFGFKDYEFEITGGSDKEGFPMRLDVEGIARHKIIITKGNVGTRLNKKGLRLRKAVRGNTVSQFTSQINLKVIKQGSKQLDDIFVKTIKEEAKEKPVEKKEHKETTPKIKEEVKKAEAKE